MYSPRTIVRVPQACRIHRAIPAARSFSYLPTPFFPRFSNSSFGFPATSHEFGFPAISQDFAPLFRLLDDITNASPAAHVAQAVAPRPAVYQPRFDVREVDGRYELRGELPGVEQQDLSVEFSDAQTLVIRGRTTRESSNNPQDVEVQPEQQQQQVQEQQTLNTTTAADEATEAADNSDAMSTHSTGSYQKPTVEDATEDGADQAAPSTPGVATPTSSIAEPATENTSTAAADVTATTSEAAPTPKQPEQQQQAQQAQQAPSPRYWVSERSVGEFQRTFNFPGRVDHDGVHASLKNGVLSIVVPKANKPASRRIQIQ